MPYSLQGKLSPFREEKHRRAHDQQDPCPWLGNKHRSDNVCLERGLDAIVSVEEDAWRYGIVRGQPTHPRRLILGHDLEAEGAHAPRGQRRQVALVVYDRGVDNRQLLIAGDKSDVGRRRLSVHIGNCVGRAIGEGEIVDNFVARGDGRDASSRLSWEKRHHLSIGRCAAA